MILAKYNQARTITFDLVAPDGVDLIVNATFAAGDIKIMKDEGVEANTTNLPTDEGTGYSLVLTAAELTAARVRVYIIDQTATKIWLDTSLGLDTYGHASAQHAFDLDTASTPQTADHTAGIADIPTVAEFNARTLVAASYFDPATDPVATVTTLTNLPTIPANWLTAAGIAASALDGKGNWNIGKTAYSLTQAFPANFADLAVTVTTGKVTAENVTLAAATHTGAVIPTVTTNTDMRGTDSAALATALTTAQNDLDIITGASGVNLLTATQASINAIEADTAVIGAAGAGLTDLGGMSAAMKTQVNAEVVDSLATDTYAELGAVPAATSSVVDKLNWLFMLSRNKIEQTATTTTLRADNTTTAVATSTVSDDGTTATRGELT